MKSFKNYIAEEHPTWHVTFKSDGHEPQKVKGRNTAEAIKKASKKAQAAHRNPKQIPMYKTIKKVSEEVEEAVGTAAKYADKKGMFGGKYTSKDHMIGMKNFQKIRDKRATQRNKEHEKQDPKMAKMGYAKHMVDTDKADKKALKRGIDPTGKYDKYKKKNGIREEVELTEADVAEILRQYALSENVNADQLAALSEEEINEIIGKAIGGAFKLGAKAAVGTARLAKKGAKAVSSQGRMDREKKRLEKEKERFKKAKESRSRFTAQGRKNRADDRAAADKLRKEREKLAQKRKQGNFS